MIASWSAPRNTSDIWLVTGTHRLCTRIRRSPVRQTDNSYSSEFTVHTVCLLFIAGTWSGSSVVRVRMTIEWSRVRILLALLGNFGNSFYPTLPVSFGRDSKSRWSLLSGLCARGSKISHTGGKCVTCRRLYMPPSQ